MARDHARIQIDIWNDDDFRQLTSSAQFLYFQLLSSATLTYAGVADWRSRRIAALSAGRSVDDVESAMWELEQALFVVVDEDTEEAFIRSFFKWDGLLQKPNVTKAMLKAWEKVTSLDLKAVIVHELRRLREQFPEWRSFENGIVDDLLAKRSLNPAELLSERVPRRVPERVQERDASLPTPYSLLPTPNSQAPDSEHTALSSQALENLFDDAYKSWPRKEKRKDAFERFKTACKKRDPHELVADIQRFGEAYGKYVERQFTPALGVWLNGERWTDELPQPQKREPDNSWMDRSYQPSKAEQANSFIERLKEIETGKSGEAPGDHRELR